MKKILLVFVVLCLVSACSKVDDKTIYDMEPLQTALDAEITVLSVQREDRLMSPLWIGKSIEPGLLGYDYIHVVAIVENKDSKAHQLSNLVDFQLLVDGVLEETFMYAESKNGQGLELDATIVPGEKTRVHFAVLVPKDAEVMEVGFVLDGLKKTYLFRETSIEEPLVRYGRNEVVSGDSVSFTLKDFERNNQLLPSKAEENGEYQFLKAPSDEETLAIVSFQVRNNTSLAITLADYLGFRILRQDAVVEFSWYQEDEKGVGFSEVFVLEPGIDYDLFLITVAEHQEVSVLKELVGMLEGTLFSLKLEN